MSVSEVTGVLGLAVAVLAAVLGVMWARMEAISKRAHKNASEITAVWATLHGHGIQAPPRRNGNGGAK